MDALSRKIIDNFPGLYVRKDLTSKLKRTANVPSYVLEYLLGLNCSTEDEEIIEIGLEKIRRILTENYVRPDDSERIKSKIREEGQYTIIDKISVRLVEKEDKYVAQFLNLRIDSFEIEPEFVVNNTKLLTGGVWCMVRIVYDYVDHDAIKEDDLFGERAGSKKKSKFDSPFKITNLTPIQMPNLNLDEIIDARGNFTKDEWIDLLLRSEGYEPDELSDKQKMHFLLRLIPLIQMNYNLVELGPRGTGKSHVYQEVSPHSILMSGGRTTSANMFYNMSTNRLGLVGYWDCVAFDEVAGMTFPDMDVIQIMKNYMANGSFARGRNTINAEASICFLGNINDSVHNIIKTTHLFNPFPSEFRNDAAFFDRIHYYLPGWETPKLRSEMITDNYGLITDCLAEFCREMRPKDYTQAFDVYFELNKDFNQRDEIAVRKTFSGFAKLLYPHGEMTKEEMREILEYAIEGRRRVKEQLKVMAGVEFIDTNLGYIDFDENAEYVVGVPEKASDTLIPDIPLPAGHVFAVGRSIRSGDNSVYRLENKTIGGTGRHEIQGIPGVAKSVRESMMSAFTHFGEFAKAVIPGVQLGDKDYLSYYADPQEKGVSDEVSMAEFVGLCSALAEKPVMESMVVIGDIKLSGSMMTINNLEDIIRVSINAGAKNILLPLGSMSDLTKVSGELLEKINPIFYQNAVDAARKALSIF